MRPVNIEWILNRPVKVIRLPGDQFQVESLDGLRICTISFAGGRMLFNGKDIETEDYFNILGMLDEADGSPTGYAIFKDDTVTY